MRKWRRKTAILLVCVLLAVLLYTALTAYGIVRYGRLDQTTPCDAAIVLGAATSEDAVSPVFRERINHGIWLYENGYADYLILTGGFGEGRAHSDASIAKQYAVEKGVPEQAILLEEQSSITEENLQYAKELMEAYGLETALIVSDPLHMKRAMRMAEDQGICACASPTPTTMYRTAKTQLPFLARETFFYIGYLIVGWFR